MAKWGPLHAHVHQILRSRLACSQGNHAQLLLPQGSRLLIAVSGGQDSQCLLRLLVDLQSHWDWQLHSVHCNHGWRPDADANADFVADVSSQWGVPCTVIAAAQPPGSEADARQWRYRTLATVAQGQSCTHVVTGHTASDRAETLLYNLLRGSGADGLQALTWQRPLAADSSHLSLVRPLLATTRAQTGQFCQEAAIPIWLDSTNTDLTYARNCLRLQVLPLLRERFNPQVDITLAQTAEILSADVAYLEQATAAVWRRCVQGSQIQRQHLREAPLALQRRVVRQVLLQQLPRQPQFAHIEKVVALLRAPNRSQSDPFPGGKIAVVDGVWIRFEP